MRFQYSFKEMDLEPVDDVDLSEFTEDGGTLEFPGEGTSTFKKHKKKIIIGGALIVLLSLVAISALVIVVPSVVVPLVKDDSNTPAPSPPPPQIDENGNYYSDIKNTTEYQIDINDLTSWNNRNSELQIWLTAMNENSEYLNLTMDDANYYARVQYTIGISGNTKCYEDWEIRVRDYISGSKTGQTEVDIKGNDKTAAGAYALPFTPSTVYFSNSSQKCENDVHHCPKDDKWSRETRIMFDFNIEFSTCEDIIKLYPDAFPNLPSNKHKNQVNKASDQYWWFASFNGTLDGDTNYEVSFTLRYHDRDAALQGGTPISGSEWSIRLYTLNGGHTNDYNPAVQADIGSMYRKLFDIFGDSEVCK